MGYKSKSKQINNFKIQGLIFDSVEDFLLLKNIEKDINLTVLLVKIGAIDLKDFFNEFKKITVKECYHEAREELDGLFKNVTELLCYEGTPFSIEYQVGCCFFDKIDILKYCD